MLTVDFVTPLDYQRSNFSALIQGVSQGEVIGQRLKRPQRIDAPCM